MKPLIRLTLKIRGAHDTENLHIIGVLDFNTAGNSICILDRDGMGVPFIEETTTEGDVAWQETITELATAVNALQARSVETEIAGRTVHSALFALRRILDSSGT